MTQHIAGPWEVIPLKASIRIVAGGVNVATIPLNKYVENGYKEANARLIASAPDLLEEARFLLDRIAELDWSMSMEDFASEWNGHVEPPLYRLKQALAKATGEA